MEELITSIQKEHGPFAKECSTHWGRHHVVVVDAQSRAALVRESCNADWLKMVIAHTGTQKTVRAAAQRRLRWVNKAIAALKLSCEMEALDL